MTFRPGPCERRTVLPSMGATPSSAASQALKQVSNTAESSSANTRWQLVDGAQTEESRKRMPNLE